MLVVIEQQATNGVRLFYFQFQNNRLYNMVSLFREVIHGIVNTSIVDCTHDVVSNPHITPAPG